MSFTKAIRFRTLTGDLKPEERTEFIKNVSASDESLILRALFHHFIQNSPKIEQEVDRINAKLSDIIETRERASSQTTAFPHTMADVSNAIIGSIASYLVQRDYFRFSWTCRSLYLACNTPNVLREICVGRQYSSFDLRLFSCAETITLSLHHQWKYNSFEKVMESIKEIPRLNTLTLITDWRRSRVDQLVIETLKLYSSNEILVNKIKVLYIKGYLEFPRYDNTYPSRFIKSLMNFKNVRFLDFTLPHHSHQRKYRTSELRAMANAFSNLKGLRINEDSSGITKHLLRATANSLEFLSIIDPNYAEWMESREIHNLLKSIEFAKLREFEWDSAFAHPPLTAILKTAKNLRKLRFATDVDDNPAQVKAKDVRNVFTQCPLLQYLELNLITNISGDDAADDKVSDILDAIDGGLFDTRDHMRDSLKIQIKGWMLGSEADECVRRLDQITNSLVLSDVGDFMIMMDFERGGDTEDDRWDHLPFADWDIFKRLPSGVRFFMTKNKNNKDMMMITNDDCRICGYSESWMM